MMLNTDAIIRKTNYYLRQDLAYRPYNLFRFPRCWHLFDLLLLFQIDWSVINNSWINLYTLHMCHEIKPIWKSGTRSYSLWFTRYDERHLYPAYPRMHFALVFFPKNNSYDTIPWLEHKLSSKVHFSPKKDKADNILPSCPFSHIPWEARHTIDFLHCFLQTSGRISTYGIRESKLQI